MQNLALPIDITTYFKNKIFEKDISIQKKNWYKLFKKIHIVHKQQIDYLVEINFKYIDVKSTYIFHIQLEKNKKIEEEVNYIPKFPPWDTIHPINKCSLFFNNNNTYEQQEEEIKILKGFGRQPYYADNSYEIYTSVIRIWTERKTNAPYPVKLKILF